MAESQGKSAAEDPARKTQRVDAPLQGPEALQLPGPVQARLRRGGDIPGSSVPALGRLIGNRAMQRVVQRNAEATAGRPVTRSEAVVQREGDEDTTKGGTPVVTPPAKAEPKEDPLSKKTSLKIISDSFGSVKKDLTEGQVEVLAKAEFIAAYDKIYGSGPYAWDKYIKPKFGDLEGFAYNNVNYINRDNAGTNIGTVVHEMLHNNTAADWRAVVGNQFDEGTTEYMSLIACNAAKAPYGKSYPDQLSCVEALVAAGLSEADLKTAYLVGGAQKLLADWFNANMAHAWAEFKDAMQAEDYALAKTKIKKKGAK